MRVAQPSLMSVEVERRPSARQDTQQAILYLTPPHTEFSHTIACLYVCIPTIGEVWQAELEAPDGFSQQRSEAWHETVLAALQERSSANAADSLVTLLPGKPQPAATSAARTNSPRHTYTLTTPGDSKSAKFAWREASSVKVESAQVKPHQEPWRIIGQILHLLMDNRQMLQDEVYVLRGQKRVLEKELTEEQAKLRRQLDALEKERSSWLFTVAKVLNSKRRKLNELNKKNAELEEKLRRGQHELDSISDATTIRNESDDEHEGEQLDDDADTNGAVSRRVRRVDTLPPSRDTGAGRACEEPQHKTDTALAIPSKGLGSFTASQVEADTQPLPQGAMAEVAAHSGRLDPQAIPCPPQGSLTPSMLAADTLPLPDTSLAAAIAGMNQVRDIDMQESTALALTSKQRHNRSSTGSDERGSWRGTSTAAGALQGVGGGAGLVGGSQAGASVGMSGPPVAVDDDDDLVVKKLKPVRRRRG